jgi:hypothetical protein
VARNQIELAICDLQQNWNSGSFLLTSVDLDVGSLGKMENVQTPSGHQLTDLTWRPVSEMRSRLFQRACSTEHGKSSNIWTFSVLPRKIYWGQQKNFHSFTVICRKPRMASSICLRATIFQIPEGTLWTI